MARIAGVDLPRNKRTQVALTYIYGIGNATAKVICEKVGIPSDQRTEAITDGQIAQIREFLEKEHPVEGDLRRNVSMAIKRLMDLGCFRGIRHRKGLPVRGQRTRTNSRTRKGPRRTVANKKKAV
ncbi:MAG: 30S ribosomal protein S13 [Bdellovibrionales bacterium CG10_big_fil_rev_8_21_14_0_10_45_34]|nr:MAG: 30S ribosomal protein S13 [Bdellovibrionales bacterium CG10_big_fil_rev_8_21_14_0_10_45_34]